MEVSLTMNLSEEEFKALTVVSKALNTTPDAICRASIQRIFDNPMDFMFNAFQKEEGFRVSEGKPTPAKPVIAQDTPAEVPVVPAQSVQKTASEPVKAEKPAEKLPSMGLNEFRERRTDIMNLFDVKKRYTCAEILASIIDPSRYDYRLSEAGLRNYLNGLASRKEIIIIKENGSVFYELPVVNGVPQKTEKTPLTSGIILSAKGKFRKEFFVRLANSPPKTVSEEMFTDMFEGFEPSSVKPAIRSAFDELALKKKIVYSGKNKDVIIPEAFRFKVWGMFPEARKVPTIPN